MSSVGKNSMAAGQVNYGAEFEEGKEGKLTQSQKDGVASKEENGIQPCKYKTENMKPTAKAPEQRKDGDNKSPRATALPKDTKEDSRERPWGWVVVVASCYIHTVAYGICWSSGIYNVILLEAFGASKAVTSWAGSVAMATMCGAGPIASILINKYDCRKVTITGSLIMSVGLGACFFANSIYFVIVSFGFVAGVGAGISYVPAVVIVSYYFDRRRSLAIGLAVCGMGIGSFVLPPLIRFLYHEFGWRGSYLVLAGVALNMCVCGAVMRPIYVKEIADTETHKLMDLSVFKNYGFLFLCWNNLFVCFGLSVVYIHLPAYSESEGTDPERSSLLMSALGISNLAGRVAFGFLGQYRENDVSIMYAVAFALSGLAIMLMPVLHGYELRVVLGCFFGFLTGNYGTLLVPIVAALVGLQRFSDAYGLLLVFAGVGSLSGAPFAGWLFDIVQQYDVSLFVGGGVIVLGAVIMAAPTVKIRRDAKKLNDQNRGKHIANLARLVQSGIPWVIQGKRLVN